MRNTYLYILAALISVITSCGDSQQSDLNESTQDTSVQQQSSIKKTPDVIYSPSENCNSFIESMDFSSLCFTEKTTPEYRVEISGDRSCQYEFYADDNNGDIHMSITYSDYENSIYASEEDPDMPKLMFEQVFKQKKKSNALYTKTTDIKDIGDDAFFGYNAYNDQKALAVRISNVSFTIQLGQIDTKTTCLLSDDELVKFGRIVLAGIKN